MSVANASILNVFKVITVTIDPHCRTIIIACYILQDQKERMDSFCLSSGMPTTVYREPTLRDLYHHILVDDKRKILFCYVPKVSEILHVIQLHVITPYGHAGGMF